MNVGLSKMVPIQFISPESLDNLLDFLFLFLVAEILQQVLDLGESHDFYLFIISENLIPVIWVNESSLSV